MFFLALSTLRFRKSGFAGAFIALFFASALVGACGILLETGLGGGIPAERYAGTPVVVAGEQSAHVTELDKGKLKVKAKPLGEHVWIPASIAGRLRSLPGVRAVIPELQFPAYVVADGRPVPGPDGSPSLGHAWTSAPLTPFTLASGRAPEAPGDVVVDAGVAHRAGLVVGSRVTIEATGLPSSYRVVGITAETLSGQAALFFSASEAGRLAGHQGEVAAIGLLPRAGAPASALAAEARSALAGTGAVVYTGDQRGPLEFPDAAKARITLISLAGVFGGTALGVAILVVAGTLALSVQQRYHELALLRAVAATPKQVRKMIGREALAAGAVAGTAGSAASIGLAVWLRGRFAAIGAIPDILHLSISPYPIVAAVGVTVAAAWIAARVAARRTTRIRPAEALAEAATEPTGIGAVRLLAGVGLLAGAAVLTVVLSGLTAQLVRSAPGAGNLRPALTSHISDVAGARVLSPEGIQAQQAAQQQVNAGIQYLAMGLIIAFTVIAVVNTLITATLDRSREFALLRMIGATRSQVRRMARWESLAVTLTAVAGGTAISLVTLAAFAHGMTGSWTPAIPPPEYVAVAAAVAVLTFLTTEASARSALRRSAASVNVG